MPYNKKLYAILLGEAKKAISKSQGAQQRTEEACAADDAANGPIGGPNNEAEGNGESKQPPQE